MSTSETTRNRLTLGFAGLVIIASLVGALYMKRVADARTPAGSQRTAAPMPLVQTRAVQASSVPIILDVRGFLRGWEEVTVHSEVSGRIISKPVEDGQHVDEGTVLCGIDETLYRLAVEKAEANVRVARGQQREAGSAVAVADAQQHDAQAALDNARIEFERVRELYRARESHDIEYERYETQFKRAEAQWHSAEAAYERAREVLAAGEAAVQVAEAVAAEARESLSRCQVRAPVAGTIDQTQYEVGEYVVAGRPLVEIIRLDRMKLIVQLTGPQAATLDQASRAEVAVDAVAGVVYPAILGHVAPKADPQTRKFRVEFHLDNEGGRLRAGMFARARIACTTWQDVITVPRRAVFRQFGADFCFVVVEEEAGPVARTRRVTVADVPDRVEQVRVLGGLSPGDAIIVERARDLKDGSPVHVEESS